MRTRTKTNHFTITKRADLCVCTNSVMEDDDVYAMLKERKSKKQTPRGKGGGGATSGKGKGKGMSEEEKRAAIRAGLARKKECERRALGIVERMIETGVDREWLRNSVGRLTTQRAG